MRKLSYIIFIIILLALSGISVHFFQEKNAEYEKRLILKDKLGNLIKDKAVVDNDLKVFKSENEELKTKMTAILGRINTLNRKIQDEDERNRSARNDLAKKEDEINKLKKELELLQSEKLDLTRKYDTAMMQVQKLGSEKETLNKTIQELKKRPVALEKIVVKPVEIEEEPIYIESDMDERDLLKGSVVVVNPEYGFIVCDLGSDSSIEKGMLFEIIDRGEVIGHVEIDKIYESMSTANFLNDVMENRVKRGNIILESR